MPSFAIFIGILLDILGIAGYVWTGSHSPTALIPAVIGTLILILGIVALRNPSLRRQAMHGAAILAALGFLGGAVRALPNLSKMCASKQANVLMHQGSPVPSQMGTVGSPDQLGAPTPAEQATALNQAMGTLDRHHAIAFWMQSLMSLLCLIFLIACIRSFINARRNQSTTQQNPQPPYGSS